MIVVDLGCFPHGHEVSIERLIERYMPDRLYGFDPYPELLECEARRVVERVGLASHHTVRIELRRLAAWTFDGEIEYARVNGERAWDSTVMREKNSRREWQQGEIVTVPCFDFALWLAGLEREPSDEPLVVKMDIEGAEFPLLEHLHEAGADALCDLLLVEWHEHKMGAGFAERRAALARALRCAVEEWTL